MINIEAQGGKTLGYYHTLTIYLMVIPAIVLLLIAIVYNIFIGIATWWVYKNANWKSSTEIRYLNRLLKMPSKSHDNPDIETIDTAGNLPDNLHTSIWEEIFVINMRVCNFLLGTGAKLKNFDHYLVLKVHDFVVFMPLGVLFLQLCQYIVCVVITVIFLNYLLLEVSSSVMVPCTHVSIHSYRLLYIISSYTAVIKL